LAELIHSLGLDNVGSKDVFLCHVVALLSDLLLGLNHLILDQKCLEDEFRHNLLEGFLRLWDFDHAKIRWQFGLLSGWQVEWSSDQVVSFLVQMLVENDVVHRLGEIQVDLIQLCGRVSRTLSSQSLGVLGHGEDTIDLVVVNLRDLVLWHVLNVVVVLDESVSVDSGLVGSLESLYEDVRVLLVEENKDTSETALDLGDLPAALESLRLG
jgi:hypothetical protein